MSNWITQGLSTITKIKKRTNFIPPEPNNQQKKPKQKSQIMTYTTTGKKGTKNQNNHIKKKHTIPVLYVSNIPKKAPLEHWNNTKISFKIHFNNKNKIHINENFEKKLKAKHIILTINNQNDFNLTKHQKKRWKIPSST